MRYRWTHPKRHRRHGHGGDGDIEQGDVFEPTDAEVAAFGDRMERVDDEEPTESDTADTDTDDSDGGDSAIIDPGGMSVSELRDHLDAVDYSDTELDAILAAERNGKDRATAKEAIERARPE